MFKIKEIILPEGKTATIKRITPDPATINIGDRMGPKGAEYVVEISGSGSIRMRDIGDPFPGRGFAVNINDGTVNWFYVNEGECTIVLEPGGYVSIKGGLATVGAKLLSNSGTKLSHLSDPHYGYDFVVATTQESINSTMKHFLSTTEFAPIKQYYVYEGEDGDKLKPIEFAALMKLTNNVDPFKVPAWDGKGAESDDMRNLRESGFACGYEAALGIPDDILPNQIPDIVTLIPGKQSVDYSLICSKFNIVQFAYTPSGPKYKSIKQPKDKPWMFKSMIDMQKIFDTSKLPKDVKDAYEALVINHGPDAFSIQQLILDLNNARSSSSPVIIGLSSSDIIYTLLMATFVTKYFDVMREKAIPVLNYSIEAKRPVSQTSLIITDMKFGVNEFIEPGSKIADTPNLNTLNYHCATDGKPLPPISPFNWNWVEKADVSDFNGVISVNKNNFLAFLNKSLASNLADLDITTDVNMTHDGETMYVTWSYKMGKNPGQTFTVVPGGKVDEEGFTSVLTYKLNTGNSDDTFNSTHTLKMEGTFKYSTEVTIAFLENRIKITTHSITYLRYWYGGYYGGQLAEFSGNIVDSTQVVYYEMTVDPFGNMGVTMKKNDPKNDGQNLDISGWDKFIVGNIVDCTNSITDKIRARVANSMTNFANDLQSSLGNYRHFVFPGGNTFSFKDVSFSDFQDLVAHISYVDPSITKKYTRVREPEAIKTLETEKN